MLIAIDVGNTNMVFGVFQGETLLGSFRLMTDVNRTSDEIGLSAFEYFHRFGWSVEQVEDVIIASVVPSVMYSLTSAMVKYFDRTPLVVDVDVDPALPYVPSDSDEHLGADRSVACVAAMEKYGKPLIVLDFGTATTVDAVDGDGVYQGGCISAGLRVSTEALFSKAAMLPHVELVKPPRTLNTTAVGQIQAGAVGGYVGAMEYLIRAAKAELGCGDRVKVVATGGLARLVADHTDLIDAVDPQLILDGLLLLYRRHKGALSE
jgi:type III pantothenate kinase